MSNKKYSDNDKKLFELIDSLGERIGFSDYSETADELVKAGDEAIPLLIENLRVSSWIPWILGKIGSTKAIEPLCELLFETGAFEHDESNPYSGHRAVSAAEALGMIGDPAALPKLEQIARETMDGTLLNVVTDVIAKIKQVGIYTPQKEKTDLSNIPISKQLDLSEDTNSPADMLDKLALSNDMEVINAVAQNPATLPSTLRNLNKRFSVEGKRLYWQFANNPNCPKDILKEIVDKCINPYTVDLARKHPNFKG
jgi:hypothetical protein